MHFNMHVKYLLALLDCVSRTADVARASVVRPGVYPLTHVLRFLRNRCMDREQIIC